MKHWIVLCVFLLACNSWKHTSTFDYTELSVNEYAQQLSSGINYVLVDVRTSSEYKKGHIKGAINLSYFGGDFKKYIDTINKDKTVFIYCQTQHRSPLSAKIMKKKKFKKVIDLKAGFIKWEKTGFPVEN